MNYEKINKNEQKRRGWVFNILSVLEDGVLNTDNVLVRSGPTGALGMSLEEWREKCRKHRDYDEKKIIAEDKRKFCKKLSYLKHAGLIERSESGWFSTKKGKEKLNYLKRRFVFAKNYQKKFSRKLIVIVFDIPEQFKRERNWLREKLMTLGFKKMQKSVWAGKIKLPEEFIRDLRSLNIFSFVIIFAVAEKEIVKGEK